MRLYSYFRSSASYRVRIALNLKGISYEHAGVHLLRNGGEQLSDAYRQINPEGLVPALVDEGADSDVVLSQSLAIIEYLEETHPEHPLLPQDAASRAAVRAFALAIACEIHPVNNLRILKYLSQTLGVSDEQKNAWYKHWCESGLQVLELRLQQRAVQTPFCFGEQPGLAECVLIPQIFNAQRFQCDLSSMPLLMAVYERCMALPAFQQAQPSAQPDAE